MGCLRGTRDCGWDRSTVCESASSPERSRVNGETKYRVNSSKAADTLQLGAAPTLAAGWRSSSQAWQPSSSEDDRREAAI